MPKLTPGVGGELPSPPPEADAGQAETATSGGKEGDERGQVYYRPSREAILAVLRRKVAHVASHFEEFDHLVRSLGRDGLLGSDADKTLVEGMLRHSRMS